MKLLKKHLDKIGESESIKLGLSKTDFINMTIGVPFLNEEIFKEHDFPKRHTYRSAELSKCARENLIRLCFDNNKLVSSIIPTMGAKGALSLLFQVLNIRKVGLLAPYWLGYQSLIKLNDIPMCVINENTADDVVHKMKLEDANALIVCNPNNPTGRAWSGEELVELIARLQEFEGVLLLDEVYKDLMLDKKNRFSDTIDAINLIRIGSISKSMGIPGLRLGYVQTMNFDIIKALRIQIQHNYTSLSSFVEYFLENVDVNQKNRYLSSVLPLYANRMKNIQILFESNGYKVWQYDAAFYLYLESKEPINLFEELKDKFGILSVSGVHYGHSLSCARISVAIAEKDYINLLERLERMIGILGKRNFTIILLLGGLVAISEVVLTLTMSNLISVLFSSSNALFSVLEIKWIALLILIYLVVFVVNYACVNFITFSKVISYSNQKVVNLILHRSNIQLKREGLVNVYVGEMFRVIDKLVINFSNIFSKVIATLLLFALGIYLAGYQFALTLGGFLIFFMFLGLSTHKASKKVSSDISASNEDRINLLTALYENRLSFMLTNQERVIAGLLEENKWDIVKVRVRSNLLTGIPRVFVDSVLFGSMLILFHFVQSTSLDTAGIVFTSVLTLRLLPILNQIYHGFSELRNNKSSLKELVANYCDTNDYRWVNLEDENVIVEWRNVRVVYDNETVVLPNLTLNRGDHLLVRGPSGSGKSTFLKLILNQVKRAEGHMGRYNSNLELSLCEQNALLFPGSVLFNITFCDSLEKVNTNRLYAVCEAVRIFDFIDSLEDLNGARIDSMGTNFSGGQKQRIALARTLFKEADVYIFDEATSALNAELQNEIYVNILSFLEDATSIHVSHQVQLFRLFSKQIVLNDKF